MVGSSPTCETLQNTKKYVKSGLIFHLNYLRKSHNILNFQIFVVKVL